MKISLSVANDWFFVLLFFLCHHIPHPVKKASLRRTKTFLSIDFGMNLLSSFLSSPLSLSSPFLSFLSSYRRSLPFPFLATVREGRKEEGGEKGGKDG